MHIGLSIEFPVMSYQLSVFGLIATKDTEGIECVGLRPLANVCSMPWSL